MPLEPAFVSASTSQKGSVAEWLLFYLQLKVLSGTGPFTSCPKLQWPEEKITQLSKSEEP